MTDGKISLPLSAMPRMLTGDISSAVKILSMPPNMSSDTVIGQPLQGEVVSHDKNIITLKTEHGLVSLETRQQTLAAIQAGDVIQLRLQQSAQLKVQNIQQSLLVELLSVNGQNIKDTALPPVAADPHVIPDRIALPQQNIFDAFTALHARLAGLPQQLDNDAIVMVMKALLRLPLQDPLPPSMQEGFEKFVQLTSLLQQANLLPQQKLQAETALPVIPEGLLTALQKITTAETSNPFIQNVPQQFIQLQTILPGQHLSPNILVDVRNQLVNILAQMNAQPLALQGKNLLLSDSAQNPAQLYTMPAVGIIIGMPATANPVLQGSNLMVMMTPEGQALVGMLAAADVTMPNSTMQNISVPNTDNKALLPGTVFVIAFQPQSERTVSIPVLPIQILAEGNFAAQPLHLGLGDTWPALDELWQAALVQQGAMPDILAAMRQTIPTPQAQQFPPALLFFLAAIKNGFFENWASPEQFKNLNKAEIVQQLLNDMRTLQSRFVDDGNPESWKPLPVPLQVGDQLMRLQFFYRHPEHEFNDMQDGQQGDNKQKKTRFILNVPQTALGDLQIDGLIQFNDLEMILRTERALPSQAEQDIRSRYKSVMDTTGMQGNILFQSGREHYIRV